MVQIDATGSPERLRLGPCLHEVEYRDITQRFRRITSNDLLERLLIRIRALSRWLGASGWYVLLDELCKGTDCRAIRRQDFQVVRRRPGQRQGRGGGLPRPQAQPDLPAGDRRCVDGIDELDHGWWHDPLRRLPALPPARPMEIHPHSAPQVLTDTSLEK